MANGKLVILIEADLTFVRNHIDDLKAKAPIVIVLMGSSFLLVNLVNHVSVLNLDQGKFVTKEPANAIVTATLKGRIVMYVKLVIMETNVN